VLRTRTLPLRILPARAVNDEDRAGRRVREQSLETLRDGARVLGAENQQLVARPVVVVLARELQRELLRRVSIEELGADVETLTATRLGARIEQPPHDERALALRHVRRRDEVIDRFRREVAQQARGDRERAGAGRVVDAMNQHAGRQAGTVGEPQELADARVEESLDMRNAGRARLDDGDALDARTREIRHAVLAEAGRLDIAIQREGLTRRAKRLVAMDMDSTLIQMEVIDELARRRGVGDEVAAITARAMHGELDFEDSLRARVALLAGLEDRHLDEVAASLPLTDGAAGLVRILSRLGYRTAVISGGFTFAAEALKQRLGLDYAYANTLERVGGRLTGRVVEPIVTPQRKADLLDLLAQGERITLDQTIAIGDGANDLPMLQRAGLGIAFHAKPKVTAAAHTAISHGSLERVLYLLGLRARDLAGLRG